ncbi:hypothetical protein [Gemmata sp.]|uniref:hypothetical protein n=1 Tax=Gemmata sp. TaxID=1914242 RepID=UPI003F71183C
MLRITTVCIAVATWGVATGRHREVEGARISHVAGGARAGGSIEPKDPGHVHTEKTAFATYRVRDDKYGTNLVGWDRKPITGPDGEPLVASRRTYRQFHQNDVLYGNQLIEFDPHVLDDFQLLPVGVSPWDPIAIAGVTCAFDPRQQALTYYHQTGPVGAAFAELRRRKKGADAKAPVGVSGLQIGAQACYALPGQKITFYEADPRLAVLTAESGRFFTHVADARKRGAELEVRVGDRRATLKADRGRKFSLLFVDQCEEFPFPKDLLTVEAVKLYFDRMADDGILALHVSNKHFRLEWMVARVAAELGLTARVWDDNSGTAQGKTYSSWVVVARKPEHLGRLYQAAGDLAFGPAPKPGADDRMRFSWDSQLFQGLLTEYDELREIGAKKPLFAEINLLPADEVKPAWLKWIGAKLAAATDPDEKKRLALYLDHATRHGPFATFREAMVADHGHAFRRLESRRDVPLWTDAAAQYRPD